jgi:hypothetical protein
MSDPVYLVDQETKLPRAVAPVSFSSLNVKERQDLEEWVLNHPEILGENLLVVTAEFDRFDKSNRRLDVLALDEQGVLTIIELKLDIAGSLADQQAIRYAAFCSTMTMNQLVDHFSQYHNCLPEESASRIREFLHTDDLPELGNRPRIILAAGSMNDPELTSCVLWLRGFGVDISCVELTPYRLPELNQILLVPRVIIPLPEARDYVISIEKKEDVRAQEAKDKTAFGQFWSIVAEEFGKYGNDLQPTSSSQRSYMQIRIGSKDVHYEWIIQKTRSRINVVLHFESKHLDENLEWLELLRSHSARIQGGVDVPFVAERWGKKWASAGYELPYFGHLDRKTASRAAELMNIFIERTLPIVRSKLDEQAHTT